MKANFTGFLGIASLFVILSSCAKHDLSPSVETTKESALIDGVYYPKLAPAATRSGGSVGFWESWEKVVVKYDTKPVNVPWSMDFVDSAIPEGINRDIRKRDGWELIAHTMDNTQNYGSNYLFFYNQFKGLLKIFYYVDRDVSKNNTAYWKIFRNGSYNADIFNDISSITYPIKARNQVQTILSSNVSTTTPKGITGGWNCGIFQLTYDPNQIETYFNISQYTNDLSTSNASITGESTTEGTIVTQSSSNSIMDKIANPLIGGAGSQVQSWAQKELSEGKLSGEKFQKLVAGIAAGAKGLVELGLNKLMGSFLGSFGTTTQALNQSVNLRTTSRSVMRDTTLSLSEVNMLPILLSLSGDKTVKLGAWNLRSEPIIYVNPLADHTPTQYDNPFIGEYYYKQRIYTGVSYDLVLNPDITNVVKVWSSASIVRQLYADNSIGFTMHPGYDCGIMGTNVINNSQSTVGVLTTANLLLGKQGEKGAIYDEDMSRVLYTNEQLPHTNGLPPSVVFIPKTSTRSPLKYSSDIFVKLTVNMATSYGDTIVSTRTFYPKIEWDPTLYNRYVNVPAEQVPYY